MSTVAEFFDGFGAVVAANGWTSAPSPSGLLAQWGGFVDVCASGYSSTIYEYHDELSVRDLLQQVLDAPTLQRFVELVELRAGVEEVDQRFRSVCRDDLVIGLPGDPWWRRCVPRLATGEFADDLQRRYGISTREP